jgi:hypothetical protein
VLFGAPTTTTRESWPAWALRKKRPESVFGSYPCGAGATPLAIDFLGFVYDWRNKQKTKKNPASTL